MLKLIFVLIGLVFAGLAMLMSYVAFTPPDVDKSDGIKALIWGIAILITTLVVAVW